MNFVDEFFLFYKLEKKDFWFPFAILGGIGFLYFIPIFNSDLYGDDFARSILGYLDWSRSGRPFSDFLIAILNFRNPFLEHVKIIVPGALFQLLSWLFLSLSACFLYMKIFPGKRDFFKVLIFLPVIISPILFECLAFKLDCVLFAFCIFTSTLAILDTRHKIIEILLGATLSLIAFSTQLVSFNFQVELILLFWILSREMGASLILDKDFFSKGILKIFIASLIYYFVVMPYFVKNVGYIKLISERLPVEGNSLSVLFKHVVSWYVYFWKLMSMEQFLGLASVLFVVLYIHFFHLRKHTKLIPWIKELFLILIFLVLLSMFCYGFLFVLKFFRLSPRLLFGLVIVNVFCFYAFNRVLSLCRWDLRFLIWIPIFYYIFFGYSFFYALKMQRIHEEKVLNQIVSVLSNADNAFLVDSGSKGKLFISGSLEFSPLVKNYSSSLAPLFAHIYPIVSGDYFTKFRLINYGLQFDNNVDQSIFTNEICNKVSKLASYPFVRIFRYEEYYIVSFKGGVCFNK